jgi:hypothetical protein
LTPRYLTPLVLLWAAVPLIAAGGCRTLPRHAGQPVPAAFAGPPTLEDVVRVVNGNSDRIRTLQARGATLTVAGMPTLRADLALERPSRFRLRAGTGITGGEVDLGSNEELFWFWAKRNTPPALFFARYDQYRGSPARELLPVEPHWLIEALGVVALDPRGQYEGPHPAGQGVLELRQHLASTDGGRTKVFAIDAVRGVVLSQHVRDSQGTVLASAVASRHEHDAEAGVTLPRRVEIQIPAAQLAFVVDVGSYAVNYLAGDASPLWTMPRMEGYTVIDLADPRLPRTTQLPAEPVISRLPPPPRSSLPRPHPGPSAEPARWPRR